MTWFTWTPLELAANFMTVVCIFLAGRNSVHTWWTGLVGCVLFAWLFFSVQLYAEIILQAFFVITGIIGWMNWVKMRGNVLEYPISRAETGDLLAMSAVAFAVAGVFSTLLHLFTDAYAPAADSLVLTFSVVAQLLLMRRHLQTWMFWLLVNVISVPLYISRGLYLTAALYAVFLVHAIWAYVRWSREYEEV